MTDMTDQGYLDGVEDQQEEKPYAGVYSVAVYFEDRAYGGPEEGGWWYNYGELAIEPDLPVPFFTFDKEEAQHMRAAYTKLLDMVNHGRPSIGSVLSRGRYVVMVHEGMPPSHWPESTPHYE